MTKRRFQIQCNQCGVIESDTSDDGLFKRHTAHRRAGYHEGFRNHDCVVKVAEETPEFQCPICQKTVIGKGERDKHASGEPGLTPDGMRRV